MSSAAAAARDAEAGPVATRMAKKLRVRQRGDPAGYPGAWPANQTLPRAHWREPRCLAPLPLMACH